MTPNRDESNSEKSDNCDYSYTDESANKNELTSSDGETSAGSVKVLNVNTPETTVNTGMNAVNKSNKESNSKEMDTPLLTAKMLQQYVPKEIISPLKGILKHSDSVTPTRLLSENITRFNTICNSGKKRPIPKFYDDVDTTAGYTDNSQKPVLINRSLSDEFNMESDLSFHYNCDKFKMVDHLTTHDGLVSLRANSVLRRASNVVKRCERENGGKENKSPTEWNQGAIEINTGNIHHSCDDLKTFGRELSCEVYTDSGIGSMEWCSDTNKDELNKVNLCSSSMSITPLMHLNKLNINDRGPWSARKITYDGKNSNSVMSRYAVNRPSTWFNKPRSVATTPKSITPRSRVTPSRCRSEVITTLKRMQSEYQYGRGSVLSAYKDLLPSPLK